MAVNRVQFSPRPYWRPVVPDHGDRRELPRTVASRSERHGVPGGRLHHRTPTEPVDAVTHMQLHLLAKLCRLRYLSSRSVVPSDRDAASL